MRPLGIVLLSAVTACAKPEDDNQRARREALERTCPGLTSWKDCERVTQAQVEDAARHATPRPPAPSPEPVREPGGVLLGMGSPKAFIFEKKDDLEEYGERVRAGDTAGGVEIVNARAVVVPKGTRAIKIESDWTGHVRVRIAEGPREGSYGWTYKEAFKD